MKLLAITVARKPLAERSVALNSIAYGVGGLNVDGARVSGPPRTTHRDGNRRSSTNGPAGIVFGTFSEPKQGPSGRWPANLILQHKAECELVGSREVEGYVINRWGDGSKPFGGGAGHPYESEDQGPEVIDVWKCVPGCPVAEIDERSEELGVHPPGNKNLTVCRSNGVVYGSGWKPQLKNPNYHGDTGTASRFFKQVKP